MIGAGLGFLAGMGVNPLWVPVVVGGMIYLKWKPRGQNDKLANNEFKANLKGLEGKDGLTLAKGIKLSEKTAYEHIGVFAPTGSGKTTGFYVSNLLENDVKGSIIVSDPKGELYRLTSHYQESVCKRKVIVYAPMNPINSFKYNLLSECKSITEIKELATSLLMNGALSLEISTGKKAQGIEWLQMATPLLSAALIYSKERGYPYNTLERALQLLITTDELTLDIIFSKASKSARDEYRIYKMVSGADRTEGSIKITLASNLQLFTDPTVNQTLKETQFHAEGLRDTPTIIYIIYPEHRAAYLSPLMSAFYSQIINKCIESYSPGKLPVYFYMDEFVNIGQLQNFSQVISTARSRKMSFTICVQNITQIQQLYNYENTMTILNNLKTKIVLPGLTDIKTLEYVSKLLGNKEVTIQNESKSKENTTTSYNKQSVKLMDDADIRQIGSDELIIVAHNKAPVKAKQNTYYKNPDYLTKVWERELPIV